jgi:hypothetical protein
MPFGKFSLWVWLRKNRAFVGLVAMSALGHMQTYAVQKGMFASPPIATAKADMNSRLTAANRLAGADIVLR